MSESIGYEAVKCQLNFPKCKKTHAGYSRRKQFAQVGPWLDACENCARVPYEVPEQFQEKIDAKQP